jgi:hypothetical protein
MTMCVVVLVSVVLVAALVVVAMMKKVEYRRTLHECAPKMMGRGESTTRTSTSGDGLGVKEMMYGSKADASWRMR